MVQNPVIEYTAIVRIVDETHLTYQAFRKIENFELITRDDLVDRNLVTSSQILIFRLSDSYGKREINMGMFDVLLESAYPGNNKILKNIY